MKYMNEQSNDQIRLEEKTAIARSRRLRSFPVFIAALALIVIIGIAAWFLWPKQAGKPVPAPRSVSFEESSPPATDGEQKLTLTPEQLRAAQLKIETVGER